MDWKTRSFIVALFVFTCWLGWKYFTRGEVTQLVATPTPVPTATPAPASRTASKEDIAKLLAVPVTVTGTRIATTSGNLAFAAEQKVGFITIFGDGIASVAAKQAITQIRETVPGEVMVAVDHEGGSVQRLSGAGFTKLPSLQELCKSEDVLSRQKLFAKSAAELHAAGVKIIFAPVVDLASKSAVLKSRVCSDDEVTTTVVNQEMISAFIRTGILPVIKHYPGIGATTRDLHDEIDAVYQLPKELNVIKTLLQVQPNAGVMTTFVLVTGLAENAPCGLDFNCVMQIDKYSKRTLIFTDALEMKSALTGSDLQTQKTLAQVSKEAVLAGNHVLVYGKGVTSKQLQEVLNELLSESDSNQVFRERVDRAIARIENTKGELEKEKSKTP
jgi:beta-N-acetylhexosaminidase